jgi:glycosyltransferase involved in cell wall biosynthesis
MPQSEVRLSIALVTRNRPESLERCLKSWQSQTIFPFELVVSDDSDQAYAQQVKELANKYNCVYTKGPQRGLYANRNHASLTCQGTHILSADDDHTHPVDYVEKIFEQIFIDPERVWIFSERSPENPETPLVCPAELSSETIRGPIQQPKDPSNCAAIADGSSVYPKKIFDQGLRYDETYYFGNMWYLWGRLLEKNGYRISFSDSTFIFHHPEYGEKRATDSQWLKRQIECNIYILFVYAWYIENSVKMKFRAFLHLARSLLFSTSIIGYKVKSRLDLFTTFRLLKNVFRARRLYRAYLKVRGGVD